ncbi:MAG: hypothetical protein HQL95_15135, partial [Magnetococcales bacterium]|nr:hypothetical protein [Magnetococcales bacterium]
KLRLGAAGGAAGGMREPRLSSEEIRVTGWGETTLQLNGRELPLQDKETPQALALDSRDRFFVLGTAFHARLYARDGTLRWKVATPGSVWAVNVSGNGQWVVAALGDGTIRWYDAMRGEELLALFVHRDQQHWAVWSPRKLFAVSSGADGMIGWHVNQGKNQLAEFHPVAQFPQFQRPEFFMSLFQ